jgi:hypothetical protein
MGLDEKTEAVLAYVHEHLDDDQLTRLTAHLHNESQSRAQDAARAQRAELAAEQQQDQVAAGMPQAFYAVAVDPHRVPPGTLPRPIKDRYIGGDTEHTQLLILMTLIRSGAMDAERLAAAVSKPVRGIKARLRPLIEAGHIIVTGDQYAASAGTRERYAGPWKWLTQDSARIVANPGDRFYAVTGGYRGHEDRFIADEKPSQFYTGELDAMIRAASTASHRYTSGRTPHLAVVHSYLWTGTELVVDDAYPSETFVGLTEDMPGWGRLDPHPWDPTTWTVGILGPRGERLRVSEIRALLSGRELGAPFPKG